MGIAGISLFVTTKSDLAARDADLFQELSRKNEVRVTVSVTTMNGELTRLMEPFAPRPDLRMSAVAALTRAGVHTGVIACPILPLLTDSFESLGQVAQAAKQSGADQFGANVLFLKPSAQRVFFPFLAERFPQHLARYRRSYAQGAFLKGRYPDRMRERVDQIREHFSIAKRDLERTNPPPPPASQLLLF